MSKETSNTPLAGGLWISPGSPFNLNLFNLNLDLNLNLTFSAMNISGMNVSVGENDTQGGLQDKPQDDRVLTDMLGVQVFFYTIYSAILITGVSGNFLVCFIVYRNKNMHTVTNIFITNLGLSDMMMCILAVPFTPLNSFLPEWYFGQVLCHVVPLIQCLSVYLSTLTLTMIAVDRFVVILYPLKPRMSIKMCVCIIIVIWVISITISLPYSIFMLVVEYEERSYCVEEWPSPRERKTYTMSTMVLQYVIPFLVITFAYSKISYRLSQRIRSKPGASKKKEEQEAKRNRRTNRMLIAMVVIFACSWLPLNMVHILREFVFKDIIFETYFTFVFFVAHVLAMSSTCYNPFLYAWLNEAFRKEFKRILPCFSTGGEQGGRGETGRAHTTRAAEPSNGTQARGPRPKDPQPGPTSTEAATTRTAIVYEEPPPAYPGNANGAAAAANKKANEYIPLSIRASQMATELPNAAAAATDDDEGNPGQAAVTKETDPNNQVTSPLLNTIHTTLQAHSV